MCKVKHAINGINLVLSTISACIYVIQDFLTDQCDVYGLYFYISNVLFYISYLEQTGEK